jgi:M6 family metalloprotease-like protein
MRSCGFDSKEKRSELVAKGTRSELAAEGILGERLDFANHIGNNKMDLTRFKQAIIRTARQHLELEGVSKERLNQLAPKMAPPLAWQGMPTTGSVKIFALLIEFADHPHNNEADTIKSRLFGSPTAGKPYESLSNYYRRASYNMLDLSSGTTLGWYKSSKNRSDIKMDDNGRDSLIKEALLHFEAQGHDFKQYDNDGDGIIDYFMVFWTGPNTGWGTFWWGYQPDFSDSSFKLDGKGLGKYSWQWESKIVGAAFHPQVAIHETGHALGLPDLYDYDGETGPDGGVGGADMMDHNYLDHNSFSKWVLGWITPKIIGFGKHTITLNPSGTSQDCVVIWPDLFDEGGLFSEYFVIQNRQPVENDIELPGKGLFIWHVDARLNSSGDDFAYDNSWASHKLVRLMEADGLEEIEANRDFNAGDIYVQGKTFGPGTVPSSTRYDGKSSSVEVSKITASGSQLSAVFKVGRFIPRTLRKNSIGSMVKTLQCILNSVGANPTLQVDGNFGTKTETAVKAFQKSQKLTQDGIVGPTTWGELLDIQQIRIGSVGTAVKILQCSLNSKGLNPVVKVDGKFGAKTEIEVKAFQKSQKLAQDGIVGPKTWRALLEIPAYL